MAAQAALWLYIGLSGLHTFELRLENSELCTNGLPLLLLGLILAWPLQAETRMRMRPLRRRRASSRTRLCRWRPSRSSRRTVSLIPTQLFK